MLEGFVRFVMCVVKCETYNYFLTPLGDTSFLGVEITFVSLLKSPSISPKKHTHTPPLTFYLFLS